MDFKSALSLGGDILGLASSAKSLFGGSKDEGDSMKSQYAWNAYSALNMPAHQVAGLRAAGLNPMLAVAKGISSPPPITSSPGSDTSTHTAKALAAATMANQAAQARLYNAQADNVSAQTETERKRPANVLADTYQKDQLGTLAKLSHATETEKARLQSAMANSEEVRVAVQKIVANPMAIEALKQAESQSQIAATSAKSAAATEKALDKLPAEWVALIRIVKAAMSGR